MGLGGCCGVVKFLMVVINIIFFILSVLIIGVAIWMLVDPSFYVSMAQDLSNYRISAYIFLAIGLLLLLVSIMGCCGACTESQCALISFFCILLIILVAEIAAGVWAYTNRDSLEQMARTTVKNTVHDEYHHNEDRKSTFDVIQQGLKCCGADQPSDWVRNKNVDLTLLRNLQVYDIPKSCCKPDVTEAACANATQKIPLSAAVNGTVIYTEGCMTKVIDAIKQSMVVVLIVGIVIVLVEVVGLVFALGLTFAINRSVNYKG